MSVVRNRARVLERVSLAVLPGTVHALVGPNGAGKSTLLQVVLGLLDHEGDVRLSFRGNGRLAYVPQRFVGEERLPLTVAELLALERQRWPVCLGIRQSARTRIASALEKVGLAGFEDRRLDALSGGERQRVLLANALEPTPELLLLDEPATGLDVEASAQLEAAVRSARTAGAAVLMASHDADVVARLADSVTRLGPSVPARAGKGAA
ncbi:MAG: ATP-binding cassette domain-containing protein [Deltaproteobacteria bacterium]|nr:ATP-binding cassette domain-containing protein [Deltaproteobacteria bacterium]